ncbi:MAG: DUF1009 domain-containing protein [Proteobacteria bacterium]|nr:DUF1009 domain-containing protein [Pseudomonadota bacterium]
MSAAVPTPDSKAQTALGIVAGGGRLPLQLVESCRAAGRPCYVIALEGIADVAALAGVPHAVVRLGAVGESLEHLRKAGAMQLVLAGHVKRPSLTSLRPDLLGAKLLARLGTSLMFAGDDAVLKTVMAFLEEEGFSVIGADTVMQELLTPHGPMGKIAPDARAEADIAQGMRVVLALGAVDVGQAAIVEHGYVLGVEAAEGTDALIKRCAGLKREAKAGVLVKLKKPAQDGRADLPTIGPDTVKAAAAAGLAGIAVETGGSLLLDKEALVQQADALGIFVVGIAP